MNTKALSIIFGLALLASLGTFYLSQHHKNSRFVFDDQQAIKDFSFYSHVDPDELHYRLTLFKQWVLNNEKQYSSVELPVRFHVWNQNYEFVQDHNSKNLSWTVGMNKFADLSSQEFAALYTGYNAAAYDQAKEAENIVVLEEEGLEESVDWRAKGAVTIIKDQGQCGACYAFASATGLEGLYFIKKGILKALSPQQIADCSSSYGNNGCNGGLMTYSYSYTKAKGIESNTNYPWKAATGSCKYSSSKVVFKNTGYSNVGASYSQLMAAVKQQPTPVAVEADQSAFQMYTSGVITGTSCGTNLDHAITAVGYDSSASTPYWIVKNQWGASWGENGYVRIKLGSDNVCGINSQATYPTYSG